MTIVIRSLIVFFIVALILFFINLSDSLRLDFWRESGLPTIKFISAIASTIFAVALIAVFILACTTSPKIEEAPPAPPEIKPVFVRERWEEVLNRIKNKEFDLAVIEADNVLDATLKNLGYRGDTIAEKLKRVSPADLPIIEDVWNAHKMRNQIVHNGYKANEKETVQILKIYKKALLELGVI
jgi:hypothetical protein